MTRPIRMVQTLVAMLVLGMVSISPVHARKPGPLLGIEVMRGSGDVGIDVRLVARARLADLTLRIEPAVHADRYTGLPDRIDRLDAGETRAFRLLPVNGWVPGETIRLRVETRAVSGPRLRYSVGLTDAHPPRRPARSMAMSAASEAGRSRGRLLREYRVSADSSAAPGASEANRGTP